MKSADDALDVRRSVRKSDPPRLEPGSSCAVRANLRQQDAARRRRIQILVADDQPLVREGLGALLSSQPDFLVVGRVDDETKVLRQLGNATPDILLLNSSTLRPSGLSMLHRLNAGSESRVCQTIMFTAAIEKEDIVRLLTDGVRGILSKHSPIELIFKCIRTVHNGELWVGRHLLAAIVDALSRSIDDEPRPSPPDFRLTRREQEILQLVAQGYSNKAIADRLIVSVDTVKHHLTNIFDKTGASSRVELTLFAVHHRLVAVA
jgi:DNA-binding NarL/FixJ family response regulator